MRVIRLKKKAKKKRQLVARRFDKSRVLIVIFGAPRRVRESYSIEVLAYGPVVFKTDAFDIYREVTKFHTRSYGIVMLFFSEINYKCRS